MRTRTRRWMTASLGLIALGSSACVPAPPARVSDGHVVFDVHIHGGDLDAHVHNHDTGRTWDHDRVVLGVPPASLTTVPAGPEYAFLGAAGDPVYVLPQSEAPGGDPFLHLGFDAGEIATGVLVDDEVHAELTSVTGPGTFHVYETEDHMGMPLPAPEVLFDSDDPGMDHLHIHTNHHTHAAWAFSAPGQYVVTMQFSGELVGGGTIESAPTPFRFIVG